MNAEHLKVRDYEIDRLLFHRVLLSIFSPVQHSIQAYSLDKGYDLGLFEGRQIFRGLQSSHHCILVL